MSGSLIFSLVRMSLSALVCSLRALRTWLTSMKSAMRRDIQYFLLGSPDKIRDIFNAGRNVVIFNLVHGIEKAPGQRLILNDIDVIRHIRRQRVSFDNAKDIVDP